MGQLVSKQDMLLHAASPHDYPCYSKPEGCDKVFYKSTSRTRRLRGPACLRCDWCSVCASVATAAMKKGVLTAIVVRECGVFVDVAVDQTCCRPL